MTTEIRTSGLTQLSQSGCFVLLSDPDQWRNLTRLVKSGQRVQDTASIWQVETELKIGLIKFRHLTKLDRTVHEWPQFVKFVRAPAGASMLAFSFEILSTNELQGKTVVEVNLKYDGNIPEIVRKAIVNELNYVLDKLSKMVD